MVDYVAENGLGTFSEKRGGGPLRDTLGCHADFYPGEPAHKGEWGGIRDPFFNKNVPRPFSAT